MIFSIFSGRQLLLPGFTLLELQVYLAILALVAVMACQVAITYHTLYDKICVSAQDSVAILAAIFQVNAAFDNAVLTQKKDGSLKTGLMLKNNKLMGVMHNRPGIILDNVTFFGASLDMQDDVLKGAAFTCQVHGKHVTWYRASISKAFSCSSSF